MRACNRPAASSALVVILAMLMAPVVLHAVFVLVPGLASFVVVSPSMEPAIATGSVVFVADTGEYAVGDVVTFRAGEGTVTHRIVDRSDRGYVTMGDANDGVDEIVTEDGIIGEVVLSIPHYGRVFDAVTSPLGYVLFVVVPAVLIVGFELRRIARALQ